MSGGAALLAGTEQFPVTRDVSIGRSGENDVVLLSPTVSRKHACLRYHAGRWFLADLSSANGTFLNGERLALDEEYPLRHGDRIGIGDETLVFSWPAERGDPNRTETFVEGPTADDALSPFQLQVVQALCGAWLSGDSLEELPTNDQIAAQLGTPGAGETVKAALRRAYAKAGLTDVPQHAKRRALCRVARQRGWI